MQSSDMHTQLLDPLEILPSVISQIVTTCSIIMCTNILTAKHYYFLFFTETL